MLSVNTERPEELALSEGSSDTDNLKQVGEISYIFFSIHKCPDVVLKMLNVLGVKLCYFISYYFLV